MKTIKELFLEKLKSHQQASTEACIDTHIRLAKNETTKELGLLLEGLANQKKLLHPFYQQLADNIQQLDEYKINKIIDLLKILVQQEIDLPESQETAEKIAEILISKEPDE